MRNANAARRGLGYGRVLRTVFAAWLAATGSAALAAVDEFTPHGGRAESVTISGSGFAGAGAVLFAGTPADSFTVDSDSQITAQAPSSFISGPITVDGVASLFHYISRQNPMSLAGPLANAALPLGVLASFTGAPNDGSWGHPGGQTFFFQDMPLTASTWIYWGVPEGGIELSMNGNDFNSPPGEVMTFNAAQSNLAAGLIRFTGNSALNLAAPWGPGSGVCTRFTLQFQPYNGSPLVPLIASTTAGLPAGVGAVAALPPGYSFAVNALFEASYTSGGCNVWQPALQLYDAAPTFPLERAFSTFNRGFWYENTAPDLGSIADLTVPAGSSSAPLALAVADAETGGDGVALTGDSDNIALLPVANIVFGGSGEARTVTLTTVAGETGSATVTITGTDAAGAFSSTSFVVSANTPPSIDGLPANVLVQLNQSSGAIAFTVDDDATAPGDLTILASSSNTTLVPNANISFGGSDANRTVTVQPFLSQTGTSTITLTVTDGAGESTQQAFEFRVNAPPQLTANNPMSVNQGASVVATQVNLRATDAESGPAELTYRLNPDGGGLIPVYGELRLNGAPLGELGTFTQQDIEDGLVSYHNDDSCNAIDQFTFNVTDADDGITPLTPSLSFRADIAIDFRNDPPQANNLDIQVGLGASTSANLPGADTDCVTGETLTYALVPATGPIKGSLTALNSATGEFTYQAAPGEIGPDQFQYEVSDGTSSAIGTISVEIINQAPTISGTSVQTQERAAVSGSVVVADVDQPPQTLNVTIVDAPSKGLAVIDDPATGAFTYTPTPGRVGADSFTLQVSDGIEDSTLATVEVDIRGIVDPGDIVVAARMRDPDTFVQSGAVVLVEPGSGDQSVIADSGMGPEMRGIAADTQGNIYVVNDGSGLLHVAAASGVVTQLNDLSGTFPLGIDFDANGDLAVALGPDGVRLFNRADGSVIGSYSGGSLEFASDVESTPDGLLYVTDAGVFGGGSNKLLRIDPSDGTQIVIASSFDFPVSLALRSDGHVVVGDGVPAFGPMPSTLKLVDPASGTITSIGDPLFDGLTGLDTAPTGEVYGVNEGEARVFLLDTFGGAQTVLATGNLLGNDGRFGMAVAKQSRIAGPRVLGVSPAPSYVGQSVTVSFEIEGDTPLGDVRVVSDRGEQTVCAGALVVQNPELSAGSCSITLNTHGLHQLHIEYLGDLVNEAATSDGLSHTVVQPVTLYRDDGLPFAPQGKKGEPVAGLKALVLVGSYASLADALADAVDGDEVVLGADTYFESNLLITQDNLTVRGFAPAVTPNDLDAMDPDTWSRVPVSIVDGGNAVNPVFRLAPGAQGLSLADMGLQNVNHSCVHGDGAGSLANTHSGFTAMRLRLDDCRADVGGINGGGIYLNGPIDDVAFVDNEVTNSAARALVIWNGLKTNIEFSGNYVHDMLGCCGIELQDGTASGVRVIANRIVNVPDSGIGLVGLGYGAGDPGPMNTQNLIQGNLVLNTGRFGIEIKLPNGSGNNTGDGSIRVVDNRVYLSANGDPDFDGDPENNTLVPGIVAWRPSEVRDLAGIAVFRRSVAEASNVDVPTGVVVQNNIVKGFLQDNGASVSEGFGIVIEGTQHRVSGNTLDFNDIGVQRQAGHTPYCSFAFDPPPQAGACDGDQSNVADQYFGRGNSQLTCALVGAQTFGAGNGSNSRDVFPPGSSIGAVATQQGSNRFYCTIQQAIDDPLTLAGSTVEVFEGITVDEAFSITKPLILAGQGAGATRPVLTRSSGAPGQIIARVQAQDVTIRNLRFDVDLDFAGSAIAALPGGDVPNGLRIEDNLIRAVDSNLVNGPATPFGQRHAISINGRGFAQFGAVAFADLAVLNNVIEGNGLAGTDVRVFGSAIEFDDPANTPIVNGPPSPATDAITPLLLLQGNDILAGSQDANLRFNHGRVLVQGNTFRGAGLEAGEAQGLFEVRNNTFAPLTPALRSFGIKSVQAGSAYVHVEGNTFDNHAIGVAVQNSQSWYLQGNTFNAPASGEFVHLWVSTKVFGSAPLAFARIEADVRDNEFNGPVAPDTRGTAVWLGDHDYRAARPAPGAVTFANDNQFSGDFARYFFLDPATCAASNNAGSCSFGSVAPPVTAFAATETRPFPVDVLAIDNRFQGVLPANMDLAQLTALQDRTYHDDAFFPESPAAPAALGRVEFGIAPSTISITGVAPAPSLVGDAVTVTFSLTGNAPSGSVEVEASSGETAVCALPAATCDITLTTIGDITLTASYSGDGGNLPSSSAAFAHRVVGGVQRYTDATEAVLEQTYVSLTAALADAVAGNAIVVLEGTYGAGGTVAVNGLTIRGELDGLQNRVAVIDGGATAGNGITLGNGITGSTIRDLDVRGFQGNCLSGSLSNHGTTIDYVSATGCGTPGFATAGIYFNGPVDSLSITDSYAANNRTRGIVIWNGLKSNILIDGNEVADNNCCGIELQDGTATGVTITNNVVHGNADNGIGLTGLFGAAGANLIAGNTLSDNGRFGIEIKIPDGDTSASTIVENNTVQQTGSFAALRPSEVRDLAGIAVFRRGIADPQNANIPRGVTVRNNAVSGYAQDNGASSSEGFGIVLEGEQVEAYGNTLTGNDVGIQRQAGHTPYVEHVVGVDPLGVENQPGNEGNQANLADQYFGRGNAPSTCALALPASNTFVGNGADTRDIGLTTGTDAPVAYNDTAGKGLFFCALQTAIDDRATAANDVLELADDITLDEQALVDKTLRITRRNDGTDAALIRAPATVTDLALLRVAAPDVEIDNLRFELDLARVGEAIRTVGNTAGGDPSGLIVRDNSITATASALPFVSYGRRNALALNLSNASGYAPPGEQVTNLAVTVRDNVIGGTQDWDAGTAGNQPAYFRAAVALDQGAGTIAGNELRGRDYDAILRFTNGAGITVGGAAPADANSFAGGGLYLGDGIAAVNVVGNSFAPDRSLLPLADFPFPVDGARWGDLGFTAVRLVNIDSGAVALNDNSFTEHSNAVFAQNFTALSLDGNSFAAPSHGSEFRHLILGTKVLSTSGHTIPQTALGLVATNNQFAGSAAHTAIAVELVNHDANDAAYANLQFGGLAEGDSPNTFSGEFDYVFYLDPTSCTPSSSCVGAPYLPFYQYNLYPGTDVAPFAGDVLAIDNQFDGVYPGDMSIAQFSDLQDRTYHLSAAFPEMPAAPASLGTVDYGTIAVTLSLSSDPDPSVVGQTVDVLFALTAVNPTGLVSVSASTGESCAADASVGFCQITFTDAGARDLTGSYAGDGQYQPANTAAAHTHTVNAAPTTTAIVSITPTPSQIGDSVTVVVDVAALAPGAGSPSGDVLVRDAADPGNACNVAFPGDTDCDLVFTSASVKTIEACYSDPNGDFEPSCRTATHLVSDAGGVVPVEPAPLPTPADNDYTRINNAVQALGSGITLQLSGTFNWTEANAFASWALGSDGIAASGDEWSILPPVGLSDVAITAAALGDATIQGPGELGDQDFEGVFLMYGGSYQGWSFSNLQLLDFEWPIGMFFSGGPIDAFEGVQVVDNRISLPSDGSAGDSLDDAFQNVALHIAFGQDQLIVGNEFIVDVSGGAVSGSGANVVLQANTSGNAAYDGLRIQDNTVRVIGEIDGALNPVAVLGIWENDNAGMGTDVRIEGNVFDNQSTLAGGGAPPTDQLNAIRYTSHSGNGKQFVIADNHVEQWGVGITTLATASYVVTPPPTAEAVLIEGNTLLDNSLYGIRIASGNGNAAALIRYNRIFGNTLGVSNFAGSIGASNFVENLGRVDAQHNWWGCNAGPTDADCDGVENDVAFDPWLTLSLETDAVVVPSGGVALLNGSVNTDSNLQDVSGTSRFPACTMLAFGSDTAAFYDQPNVGTGVCTGGSSVIGEAENLLRGLLFDTTATLTLDAQTVSRLIQVEQVLLSVNAPSHALVDTTTTPFPVRLTNDGSATPALSVHFAVSALPDALLPADVLIEYEATPGNWTALVLSDANLDGVLEGSMPVGVLGAGAQIDVPVRATFARDLLHGLDAVLVSDVSGHAYAEAGASIQVVDTDAVAIVLLEGSPQTAPVNTAYALPLRAMVVDSNSGAPLSGVQVSYAAAGIAGADVSLSSASQISDADGEVAVGATANAVAGAVPVTAALALGDCTGAGPCSIEFDLQNTAGVPARLEFSSIGPASATVATLAAYQVRAEVFDADDNPLDGIGVNFVVQAGGNGASATPALSSVSTVAGIADRVLDANTITGSFNVTAVVSGLPASAPIGFTNLAAAPASIEISSSPESLVVGEGSYFITAQVRDAFNNPVPGAAVSIVGPASGAGIAPATLGGGTGASGQLAILVGDNGIAGSFQVVARIGAGNCGDVGVLCSPTLQLENLVDLDDLAVSLSGDSVAAVVLPGDARQPVYTVSTTVSDAAPAELVTGYFAISRVGGIDAADLSLEYSDPSELDCGSAWCPLPLTLAGGLLEGSFGPAGGFPMTDGASSQFRVTWSRGGSFDIAVQILGAVSGDVYAETASVVDVAELALSSQTPGATALAGEDIDTATRLQNLGSTGLDNGLLTTTPASAPNDASIRVLVEIAYDDPGTAGIDAIAPSDALIRYFDDIGGVYTAIPAAQGGAANELVLAFGPGAGFPTPAGYDSTTLLRSAFFLEGEYQIRLSAVGIDSAGDPSGEVFAETTQTFAIGSGQAASLQYVAGDAQSSVVDTDFASTLRVRVLNASGNPVRNESVLFAGSAADAGAVFTGDVTSLVVQTDNDGFADSGVFAANTVTGTHAVVASVTGVATPVVFDLQNLPGAANTLELESGTGQVATVGAGFADLVARVRDSFGNPVPGTSVRFSPPAAGSTAVLSGGTADGDDRLVDTDAEGRVRVGAQAGLVPGSYAVTASSAGLVDVQFGLENRAGDLLISAIRWSGNDLAAIEFDGDPQQASFDVAPSPVDLSCEVRYNASLLQPTNAGSYAVEVSCESAAEGLQGQAAATLTIDPQAVVLGFVGLAQTFDGSPRVVTSTPVNVATQITYDASPVAPVAAGNYAVQAVVTDPNYSAATINDTLVVAQAGVQVTLGNLGQTWDGSPKPVSVSTTPAGVAVTVSYDASSTAPSDAGTYLLSVVVDDANYVLTGQTPSDPASLVISKATLVLSDLRFASSGTSSTVFDGAPQPALFSSVVDLPANNIVCVTEYDGGAAVPVNAGDVLVSVDCEGPNHIGSASATLSILPASASVSLSDLLYTYDGNGQQASVVTSPVDLPVTVSYDGGAALPVDAGSYAVLAVVADPNYSGSANGVLVISPAAASITLDNLLQVFDGSPKAVDVVTDPLGLPVSVLYDGSATAPSAIGSYAVSASVTDPNYLGSASALLQIVSAEIETLELVGNDTFDGVAGAALGGALPRVRVRDANGDPVAGVAVRFQGSGQGSLSGAQATTDANGQAGLGGWTLSPDAGANVLTASLPGRPDILAISYTANGSEQADLAIQKTGTAALAQPGSVVDYLITVANAGPSNAASLDVLDALPDELDLESATWICVAQGGASCSAASGSGDVDVEAGLPVGGSISIVVSARIRSEVPNGPFVNTAAAELLSGTDPQAGNNADDFSIEVIGAIPPPDGIFSDGFEALSGLVTDALQQGKSLSLQPAWNRLLRSGMPQPLLAVGKGSALQGLAIGDSRWVRIVERGVDGLARAQPWQPLEARSLMLNWQALDEAAFVQLQGVGELPLQSIGDLTLQNGSRLR